VLALINQYGDPSNQKASFFNFCLTNGKQMLATRYCSDKTLEPRTLHYAVGRQFVMNEGHGVMEKAKGKPECILVSSEKLTDSDVDWQIVPPEYALLVTEGMDVSLRKLK
jgi:glutamine amidotransferase